MNSAPVKLIKNYALTLLGAAVYALAFDAFFVPNGVAFGGVTGLAQIVNFFLPSLSVGALEVSGRKDAGLLPLCHDGIISVY